jgi:hypothetical protein
MELGRQQLRLLAAMRRRRTTAVLALLAALVVYALWSERKSATKVAPVAVERVELSPSGQRPDTPNATPSSPSAAAEPAPVIDEIVVEKPEVCEGEENLVTVRAHTTNGTDALLHYAIDGRRGSSVPVQLVKEGNRIAGKHLIQVFGRNNVVTTVPLPEYQVRDCQPTYVAFIESGLRSNSSDVYDFVARVVPSSIRSDSARGRPAAPFVGTEYRWSFGDGESATTDVPAVSHDYGGRPQETKFSEMLVRVEVRSKDGDHVAGRKSLYLVNTAFEALAERRRIQLVLSLDPRFPELDDRGRVVQHARLRHIARQPVRIDEVTMTKYFARGKGRSAPQSAGVADVLGTTTIPAGKEGITATVVLDTVADPDVFAVTYALSGRAAGGEQVMGSFSVMRPPPRPNAENSTLVTDPLLQAKILAAQGILGKDVVSADDLVRLERLGRFASLGLDPSH